MKCGFQGKRRQDSPMIYIFFQVATNQHRVTGILESLKIEFTTGKYKR